MVRSAPPPRRGAAPDVITERHRKCVPIVLEGEEFCSPGPPEAVLLKAYGEGWRRPDKNFTTPFPYGDPAVVLPGHAEWPPLFFREQKAYDPKKRKYFNSLEFLMSKCGRTSSRSLGK